MQESLAPLISKLSILASHATSITESWDMLALRGGSFAQFGATLLECQNLLRGRGYATLTVDWDEEAVDEVQIRERVDGGEQPRLWQVSYHKFKGLNATSRADAPQIVFFCVKDKFLDWASRINPFESNSHPFKEDRATIVYVNGLPSAFGGERLAFCPPEGGGVPVDWPSNSDLPSADAVRQQIHIVGSSPLVVSPQSFGLSWGAIDSEMTACVKMASAKSLAAALANTISSDSVTIYGVKHRELVFSDAGDSLPTSVDVRALVDAVSWAYSERAETRLRLLADRLSLDIPDGVSFLSGVMRCIRDALRQSREQYDFVILDRREAYAREVRELLRDLKAQTKLYAEHTRSVLSCLLRDVLAVLALVGINFAMQPASKPIDFSSPTVAGFFKSVGVFLLISLLLQMTVHLRDIWVAEQEAKFWMQKTCEYMSKTTAQEYFDQTIGKRRRLCYGQFLMLGAIYLIVSAVCFAVPRLVSWLMPCVT